MDCHFVIVPLSADFESAVRWANLSHLSIHCSQLIVFLPLRRSSNSSFCIIPLDNPSAMFSFELTNPMLEMSFAFQDCLAACISNMILFSHLRELLMIISERDFELVSKWIGTARCIECSICERNAKASSNTSASAITFADNTERVTLRDLKLLNTMRIAASLSSIRRIMWPSWDFSSWLLANAE